MLLLDAAEVAVRLDRHRLIDALDAAFHDPYEAPDRQAHALDNGRESKDLLLIMPAWRRGGSLGVKLCTVFPGNAALGHPAVHATYAVFDAVTGIPRAILDGTELTLRRTAAASALAARYLARADSSRLLMVGTGALAPHIIDSYASVMPLTAVQIWGRRRERADGLAGTIGTGRPYTVTGVSDLEAAVRWADIISCATLAESPLVHGSWLQPGQHLDLIGSFTAAMREADDEALRRSRIYVDTRAGALTESGEILHALANNVITEAAVLGELTDLVRHPQVGRRSTDDITLFKSVGCALEDLAAAELALRA